MKVYKKSNIINMWDNVISEKEFEKLYNEIKFEILNDILRDKYVDMVFKDEMENEGKVRTVINDTNKWF